mmetsp:Transcript_2037/g.4129  ORF Transcript_2037/g.4129 Transcript_2037/m.4129 type:complete len:278 (-) Transcript_2037:71-904(-)
MRQLLSVSILILVKVVLDVESLFVFLAKLVRKDTNLDLCSFLCTNGSGIVRQAIVVAVVVNFLAGQKLSGIDKSIVFHVFNLGTFLDALIAVKVLGHLFLIVQSSFATILLLLLVSVLGIFVLLLFVFTPLVASFAHFVLVFGKVFGGEFEVALQVDNVFTIVFAARFALIRAGAQAENGEPSGSQDGAKFIVFGQIVIVTLDKLAFLEFDRVSADIHRVFVRLVQATNRFGLAQQVAHMTRMGSVGSLWGKRVGRNRDGQESGKAEFHCAKELLVE